MGEFIKATYAYMVPVKDGVVPEDTPEQHAHNIYKIPADGIQAFLEKFAIPGYTWHPLYDLQDVSALSIFDGMRREDQPRKKR